MLSLIFIFDSKSFLAAMKTRITKTREMTYAAGNIYKTSELMASATGKKRYGVKSGTLNPYATT